MKPHEERLKEELVNRGLVGEAELRKIQTEMTNFKTSFKECAIHAGVDEEEIAAAEAGLSGVPYLDLSQYLIDSAVTALVPEVLARKHFLIPVFRVGKKLTLAMADPLNIHAVDEAAAASGAEVETVMSSRKMIRKAIDQYYGIGGSISDVTRSMDESEKTKTQSVEEMAEEAPVIKLVNILILQALEEKASDIHLEPEENMVRVRNRVDGVMHEMSSVPKKLQMAVISRIKIMAKLDIAETRRPQDGKIQLKMENRDLDIRVSTFPTMHGENLVMRLLEHSRVTHGLQALGMTDELLKRFEPMINRAYGIVLVTGPTGSGKTTTLYSVLHQINTVDKNIITIEDPVEYQLEMIRQTQINPKAGLTFASGLRSILRQDPDVIFVGEIRDSETADIAIQAALTGHLVFSSIHTNDAPGAVARLLDMGVEPFLISSALIGVLAQRLVRTVCEKCKEKYTLDPKILKNVGLKKDTLWRGRGCNHCRGTGYSTRIGIFELLTMDESIRQLVLSKATASQIKAQAQKNGMISMHTDGLQKVENGSTTLEEVLRVTSEEQ